MTVTCNLQFRSAYNALIDSVVYAILPCSGESFRAAHRRLIQDIGAYTSPISAYPIVATVGGVAHGPTASAVAYRSRSHVELSAAPTSADRRSAARYRPARGLCDRTQPAGDRRLHRRARAGQVRRHRGDPWPRREHQTDFMTTLRAYLDTKENRPDRHAVTRTRQHHPLPHRSTRGRLPGRPRRAGYPTVAVASAGFAK